MIALLAFWFASGGSAAAEARDAAESVPVIEYHVRQQSLTEVVAALSNITGVSIDLSDGGDRQISSLELTGTLAEVVGTLADRYGYFFAFDGNRYHLTLRADTQTTVMDLPKSRRPTALRLMDSVYPFRTSSAVQTDPDLGVVLLRGPSDFLDAARQIFGRAGAASDPVTVIRFGLPRREAPAADAVGGQTAASPADADPKQAK